jgi:phage protein D
MDDITSAMVDVFATLESSDSSVAPSDQLVTEVPAEKTNAVSNAAGKTRRGKRGKKFKGEHLICATDEWSATEKSYSVLKSGTAGTLSRCTRKVNCHASNEAWTLTTPTGGEVLCFIAKEHDLQLEGAEATLSNVIERKGFKGCTLKVK